MYKAVKKIRAIWPYMEALKLHTGAPTVNFEDNTIFFSVVEAKRVTPRVKHIYIPVCFLQEKFYNGLFFPKYENYSNIPSDICTKRCPGPNISWGNKCITGFRLYPYSDDLVQPKISPLL